MLYHIIYIRIFTIITYFIYTVPVLKPWDSHDPTYLSMACSSSFWCFFLAIFGQVMSLPFASSVNLLSDLVHSCNDYVANYIRMHAIYCPKVEWRWAPKKSLGASNAVRQQKLRLQQDELVRRLREARWVCVECKSFVYSFLDVFECCIPQYPVF